MLKKHNSKSPKHTQKEFIRIINNASIDRNRMDSNERPPTREVTESSDFDRESFNRNASQLIDEQLKKEVRDLIRKIEIRYGKSRINNSYKFPNTNISPSSEDKSLASLKGVTYYHLYDQNKKAILDETGMLMEIIYEMANLDRNELFYHLK